MNAPSNESRFTLLTAPGPAAIAVLRLVGPSVPAFCDRHVRLRQSQGLAAAICGDVLRSQLLDADGQPLDDILVSIHAPPPMSDVRLHLHGSAWLVAHCCDLLRDAGFSQASDAEDAPLWLGIDQLDAECTRLLPQILTERGAIWLCQNTNMLRGRIHAILNMNDADAVRELRAIQNAGTTVERLTRPTRIALIGPPNAGKSTLLNALTDQPVSIVSTIPGTTRDWLEAPGEIAGFPVTWIDTAGLREPQDALEAAGIEQTKRVLATADQTVVVLDGTAAADDPRRAFVRAWCTLQPACVVCNKSDLPSSQLLPNELPAAWRDRALTATATDRIGLEILLNTVGAAAGLIESPLTATGCPFTTRQRELCSAAAAAATFDERRAKLRLIT